MQGLFSDTLMVEAFSFEIHFCCVASIVSVLYLPSYQLINGHSKDIVTERQDPEPLDAQRASAGLDYW